MNWLVTSILLFLGISLVLYVLLAGADFGAGILELFVGRSRREEQVKVITHAIAPVWEANHVWLILAVVILFVGFPSVYTSYSTYLHIPVLAILLGIVLRGCAFTFRHYDTVDRTYYRLYSRVFAASSLWTSLWLGVAAGAAILGRINPEAMDYHSLYLAPWLNGFCFAMGGFAAASFAFLAAVYLSGETADPDLQAAFRRKASYSTVAVLVFGLLVFAAAEFDGFPLTKMFFGAPVSLGSFIAATLLWIPFWPSLRSQPASIRTRAIGVAIICLVLFGWYGVQYPVALRLSTGALTFPQAAAPEATLKSLLIALVVGSLLIFPALGYLLRVFKWETLERG